MSVNELRQDFIGCKVDMKVGRREVLSFTYLLTSDKHAERRLLADSALQATKENKL